VQTREGVLRSHYFLPVPSARRLEIDEVLDQLRRLLGKTRFSVRFPGRVQATMLA